MGNMDDRLAFRLYLTSALNLLADSISSVALPLAFLQATGSVSLSASLVAAGYFPGIFLTLPLGALADRLPRIPLVALSYVVESLCLAALALALHLGVENVFLVSLIGFLRGAVSELSVLASAGYVPQVLGRENLLRFHSRIETIEGGAAIAGPSLSGWVVGIFGGILSIFLPSAISAVNAVVYCLLPRPRAASGGDNAGPRAGGSLFSDVVASVKYVTSRGIHILLLSANFFLGASTASYIFGVVVHLRNDMGLRASSVGLIMAASGAGGIVCSLILDRLFNVGDGKRVLLGAVCTSGVLLSSFGFVSNAWAAAAWLFMLDFAWVACFIFIGTLQQYFTPDRFLARVESINGLVFTGGAALASMAAASWLENYGARAFLTGVGAIAIVPVGIALMMKRGACDEKGRPSCSCAECNDN